MGKKLLIGFLVITLVFSNSLVSLAGEEENTIETSDLEENGNMVEVDDSLGTSDILEDNDESNITEVSENISQVEIDEKLSNIKYNEKKEKILDENEAENVLNDSQKEEDTNGQSNVIWNGDNNTEWEGKGTSDSPYLIKCAEDLAGISYKSKNNSESFEGVYFQLINDIYLNDITDFNKWEDDTSKLNTWQAIESFEGVFQGDNHTIYGMFCNSSSDDGLFKRCRGAASIKNLHIDKSLIINTSRYSQNYVGGIVGFFLCNPTAIIQNCSFSGIIKCGEKGYVGGIAGFASSSANTNQLTIKECKNYAYISGGSSAGGIVGYADQDFHKTVISKCTNYGEICGKDVGDTYIGGIVGRQKGDDGGALIIEQCNNLGIVSGGEYTGGILGYAYPSFSSLCTIEQCYNVGNVESSVSSGYVGGIIGISYACVSGQTNIQNCFNIGNIKSIYYAGGIAGAYSHQGYYGSSTKRIQQSYNSGNIVAKYQAGIIPTFTDSVFSDCFYLDSCCESCNSVGKKLSESEMMEHNSFTNYDFDAVWNTDNSINLGYPYLRFSSEGLPEKDSPSDGDNINQSIIDRVSEYTSDEIYAQFNAISESDYSYEVKSQMWLNLFTNYGITDVCEGIKYLSNTTDKRYAYLNLTNSDMYCASNFQYMLDHTAKGWAMRAVLLADGLVFNGEINDWLDFTTHMETEYPGVAKYKAMLYDFMDATSQSIEMQSIIKLVSDLSKNVTGAAKIKADNFIEQLNACENIDEIYSILQSNKASEVWAELSTKHDKEGNVIFKYKLDDSSGFGQFEKAMGYATKTISIVDMTITDILDLLTLDSKLAVYSQYKRFLNDIWSNTEYIPYQMRWAAALILNEIEEGYLGKIIDIAIDIIGQTELTGMVKKAILEKVGASSFSSWLTVINIEAFFINKIADIGSMVKKEAYVEGYAYLANAFTKQLKNSKQAFLSNKTEQNAWDFYYNYNVLYRLRYKGEESYLAMTKVDGIAGLFSDYGYAVREEAINDTLKMLKERCPFTFDESKAIPESCQFATKSVINCPVNVEVYTADGNLIATLLDGEESDVTNDYGRFVVVYDSYSGDYIKVICLNSTDIFKFKLIGTDEGLVNMELAQAGGNDSVIYYFNNIPISSGMVIEADIEQITQRKTYNIDKDGDGNLEEIGMISIKNDNQYISVDSFSLNQEKIELEIGDSDILQTAFSPLEASCQSVFWLSDNPAVATVKDGKVTAISEGKAKIYCTSLDAPDIIVSCEVSALPKTLMEQKYAIILDANGGTCDTSEIETNADGKIEKLPEASREGHEFKGWFTEAENGNKITEETIFAADTTIYAHWEPNGEVPPEQYTIMLDANGGICDVAEIETDANGKIVKLPEASREGHKFKGWFTGVESGDEVTEETVFTADTTIYAHWESNGEVPPEKYTITLDANGGSCETGEVETDAEGKIAQLPEASREGYEFKGWFTEAENGDRITEETVFTADTTIYAHWELNGEVPPEKHTITLDANGGNCGTGEVETDAEGKIAQLPEASREGYEFKGWFTEAENGDRITEETVFTADTTVYAHWELNGEVPPEKHTITLDANGGNCETGEVETDAEGKIAQLPEASWEGHEFKGWFTEAENGDRVTEETVFSVDATIYAHWTIQKGKNDDIEKDGNGTVSGTNTKTNSTAPRTGDNNDILIWFAIVMVSGIILLKFRLFRFKRNWCDKK